MMKEWQRHERLAVAFALAPGRQPGTILHSDEIDTIRPRARGVRKRGSISQCHLTPSSSVPDGPRLPLKVAQ